MLAFPAALKHALAGEILQLRTRGCFVQDDYRESQEADVGALRSG